MSVQDKFIEMDADDDGLLVDDDTDVDVKDELSCLGVDEVLERLNQVVSFVKERFGDDLQCLLLYDAFRRPFLSVRILS